MRGFEVVSSYSDKEVVIPVRKTNFSAGYDLELVEDLVINKGEVKLAKTGLKAFMMEDEVLYLYPRSSLAMGKARTVDNKTFRVFLRLANDVGVIDADYYNNPDNEGHIMCLLHNFGEDDIILKKGERVCQGIFAKYLATSDEITNNNLRTGGLGSTGK